MSGKHPLNILFAATPESALPLFYAIYSSKHHLVAVLTRADRPAGRGLKQRPSALKREVLMHGLTLLQPERLTPQTVEKVIALRADLMITMSYGVLLPKELLASLSIGCINIHTSLLPRWRGAAPVARAIEAGDTETGISLMLTSTELDTGPIISQRRYTIMDDDTVQSLEKNLIALGTDEINRLLCRPRSEICKLVEQAQEQATDSITYAPKLNKQEAWINWNDSAHRIARKIRAYNPWPVAQTNLREQVLRIWSARVCNDTANLAQLKTSKHKVYVGCGDGALELLEVQLPGGRPMSATAFANGHKINGVTLERHDVHRNT